MNCVYSTKNLGKGTGKDTQLGSCDYVPRSNRSMELKMLKFNFDSIGGHTNPAADNAVNRSCL